MLHESFYGTVRHHSRKVEVIRGMVEMGWRVGLIGRIHVRKVVGDTLRAVGRSRISASFIYPPPTFKHHLVSGYRRQISYRR